MIKQLRHQLAQAFSRFFRSLDERDVHVYGGIIMVGTGLAFVYWPLALIIPGAILLYIALRRTE